MLPRSAVACILFVVAVSSTTARPVGDEDLVCFGVASVEPGAAPGEPAALPCVARETRDGSRGVPLVLIGGQALDAADASAPADIGRLVPVEVTMEGEGRLRLEPRPERIDAVLVADEGNPSRGFVLQGVARLPLGEGEDAGSLRLHAGRTLLFQRFETGGPCSLLVDERLTQAPTASHVAPGERVTYQLGGEPGCPAGTFSFAHRGVWTVT